MSSDEEITDVLETPDSEEEMRMIMTEILQPRTYPTEPFQAFPDLESALEFVCHELETPDQARINEPPIQTNEVSGMTDSIVITTERVPPQMGLNAPYEPPAMSEFDVNQTAGAELQPLLGIVEPYQIPVPEYQNQPALPTHQLGECSSEPTKSHDVSAFLIDNYPVTLEDLDEFPAVEEYLELMAIPDFEISHPTSELHGLTVSSLADSPSHEAPIRAEPDATEEAIYLSHQSTATLQLEANAAEFSNLIDSHMADAHTKSGSEGPYHRAVPECQNQSASLIHQHDESNTQPALESPDIAMKFTDSNPVNQQDLQALQEALSIVYQPPSPSFFNIPAPGSPEIAINFPDGNPVNQQDLEAQQEALGIVSHPSSPSSFDMYAPASPDLTESPMALSPISRSLTNVEANAFEELLNPPHQPTVTSESSPVS